MELLEIEFSYTVYLTVSQVASKHPCEYYAVAWSN